MAAGGVLVGRGYVSIRPEFEGDWSRRIGAQGASAGEAFVGAFGKVLKTAAIPIAAVATSAGAALANSFTAAGAGAGAFVAAVKPQLTKVTGATEAYTKAQDAQAKATQKAALAHKLASKGGEEYKQALADAKTATKQAKDAQDAYDLSLQQMPPATRQTAKAFVGLKADFTEWSDSLSGTTMPLFTRGIEILRGLLPRLTPLVKSTTAAFKGFLDNLGEGQAGRVFGEFARNMQSLSGGALTSFLAVAKNVAVGLVGIVNAFAPMSQGLTTGLEELSARFADFGANLKSSAGFQQFMAYVRQNGPVVANLIQNLAATAGHLLVALAPLGGNVLLLVDAFASLVSAIPTPVLSILATVIATVVVGLKTYALAVAVVRGVTTAWATAQAILNGTLALNPIGIVIAALVALGAALYLAWRRSATFRAIVQGAWNGIKIAAQAVIGWFTGSFVPFFTKTLPGAFNATISWAKGHWPLILSILTGPIGAATIYIVRHWSQIRRGISDAWDAIKRNTLYPIRTFFTSTIPGWAGALKNRMVGAFRDAKNGIDAQWKKLQGIAKAPISFIINTVYNRGIVGVWNKVAGAFGAPKLGEFHPKGFAAGGILPGYTPGRDVHLAALSGGEAVMRPEWTRAMGPGYVDAMNSLARRGGVSAVQRAMGGGLPAFKDGGTFGWIGKAGSALKGVGSAAWDAVKKSAGWLKDTILGSVKAGVKKVVNPLINRIPGINTGFGKMVKGIPNKILDAIFGYSKQADDKGGSGGSFGGGRIPAGKHLAVINAALRAAGVPPPGTLGQWQAGLNTLITRESGWNASAINRWDSNAKAGHPSQGLAQTIPGTFNAYVPRSLRGRGILDPVANVAAAIRYIVSRYGNITRVQQANANRPPAGYDSGGWLQPGITTAVNASGQPEAVLTAPQWRIAEAALARSADPEGLHVKVYVGDREITDIARAEVRRSNGELVTALTAGRRG